MREKEDILEQLNSIEELFNLAGTFLISQGTLMAGRAESYNRKL